MITILGNNGAILNFETKGNSLKLTFVGTVRELLETLEGTLLLK